MANLFVDKVGIFIIKRGMFLWIVLLVGDKITDLLTVTFHDFLEDNWLQSGTLFATLSNTHQAYHQ